MSAYEHWSNYWQSQPGGITDAAGFHSELTHFWEQQFSSWFQGQAILEVGAGNGELMRLLDSHVENARIIGVDAASISVQVNSSHQNQIELNPETPLGEFQTQQTFDHIYSQFTLEYTDLADSVKKLGSLAGESAKIVLVMHEQGSLLAQGATYQLEEIAWLTDELQLLEHVRTLLALKAQLNTTQQPSAYSAYREHRKNLNQLLTDLFAYIEETKAAPYLYNLASVLDDAIQKLDDAGIEAVAEKVNQVDHQLSMHKQRIAALQTHAMDQEKLDTLVALLEQEGFSVTENDTLKDNVQLAPVAHYLVATRLAPITV